MCERREKALFIERSREHLISAQAAEINRLKKLLAEHNISIDK